MKRTHDWNEDPELRDDTDPEYEQEMFEMVKFLGWQPEDLRDRGFAARFVEWLKTAPPKP